MNATVLGIIIAISMLILMTFIKKDSKNSYLGINLKRIYCPNCNEKQPIIRTPANQREALYGGNTCKKCGTEMDKYGTKITE